MYLWTAFMLGLVGSLHCLGMCGPLAIALPLTGRNRLEYLAGRMIYNFGRVCTYGLLGIISGWAGKTLALVGFQRGLSISIGIVILGSLVIGPRLWPKVSMWAPVHSGLVPFKKTFSRLINRKSTGAMFGLGLLNGLLPCGLVYVAMAGAATTGHVVRGIQYMVVFGLGTFPLMLAASLSGKLIQSTFRFNLRKVIPVALFTLAILFILRGMSLNIPYISPDLSSGGSCH